MTTETSSLNKKTTPQKWNQAKDINSDPNVDQHPNIYRKKTRSGHVFELNDSKGAEHVTLQHRSGSKIQFRPDGAIEITSHNGAYNIIFGEKRMKITGAYDVTVDGAASLRVNKDYNLTVAGDCNFTVEKDFNITAKNMNSIIRENIHTVGKNMTTKIDEAINTEAQTQTHSAEKGMTIQSVTDSAILSAKKDAGIYGGENIKMEAVQKLDMKGSQEVNVETPDVSIKGSRTVALEGSESLSIRTAEFGMESDDDLIIKGKVVRLIGSVIHAIGDLKGTWFGVGILKNPLNNPTKTTTSPKTIKYAAIQTTVKEVSPSSNY